MKLTTVHRALLRSERAMASRLSEVVASQTAELAASLDATPTASDTMIATAIAQHTEALEAKARQVLEEDRRRGHAAMTAALLLLLGRSAAAGPVPPGAMTGLAAKSVAGAWGSAVAAAFHRWRRSREDAGKLATALRRMPPPAKAKVGVVAATEAASAASDAAHDVALSMGGPYRTPGRLPEEALAPGTQVVVTTEVVPQEPMRTRWFWDATLDARVCPVCRAMHGTELSPGKGEWPPAHPRCRCVATPQVVGLASR